MATAYGWVLGGQALRARLLLQKSEEDEIESAYSVCVVSSFLCL